MEIKECEWERCTWMLLLPASINPKRKSLHIWVIAETGQKVNKKAAETLLCFLVNFRYTIENFQKRKETKEKYLFIRKQFSGSISNKLLCPLSAIHVQQLQLLFFSYLMWTGLCLWAIFLKLIIFKSQKNLPNKHWCRTCDDAWDDPYFVSRRAPHILCRYNSINPHHTLVSFFNWHIITTVESQD